MNITGLGIDGYGIWSGLRLEGLSDGLNVLFGPNEAGKTTLLQFIRSVLYGFSPARRRYFPPLRGGRPGGSVDLAGPNGRFRLKRHDQISDDGGNHELLALTAADGTRQGEHLIKVLLSEVDEAVYNNVFAVGLREMQELGTLGDTEAAELLYRLTAGLDRVSLVEVIRELETSRNRILDPAGGPSQVVQLLDARERLRAEIEELGTLTRRYGRLATEQDGLQREVTRLEEENNQLESQARVIELAITLRDRWCRGAALDDQLAALGPSATATMPDGAVERLDALNARLQKHQQRAEEARRQREQLRAEAAGLGLSEALCRQAARIESLQEQQPWIATLRDQIGKLETEIAELHSGLAAEREQLGLGDGPGPDPLPEISAGALVRLRPAARATKRCRRRLGEAEREAAAAGQDAETLSRQITAALAERGQRDLATAVDGAGNLVSQLRRSAQIDERLDQMTLYQRELEEQSRRLIDRQLLPVWVLLPLGAVFVLGVVLVMTGLFMPTSIVGSAGWALALLGLAGSGAAGFAKVMLERSNARQLETCRKQINMLQLQVQQAKEEREALDRQLPGGGGPVAGRLEAAERQLAALEELLPLDARRTAARQEARAAAGRVTQAQQDLGTARGRWREALAAAGLPEGLAPRQVRGLIQRCDQIGQIRRRLEDRREELDRRRRELDSMLGRITQLVSDTGAAVSGDDPVEQLHQLGEALKHQQACLQRREVLRRQARGLRRRQAKHEEAVSRLRQRRRRLLREADAKDEQDFRHRAVQVARADVLRGERDALAREITAAIGESCPEEAVRQQLEGEGGRSLEARRDQLLERLSALEKELQDRFEQRGRLAEQLKALAEDQRLAAKQLELATIDKRLEEAVARWQVLAVTGRVLDAIKTTYEEKRQPQTLQEASGYLDRMTQGRYRRVWTPLGEDVLRVDDAEGNSLPVDVLSRGAREQLFLSLRLALAASYARRGAPLPLVLDDVLVNFDASRAKAAAAVLRDFAAAGHQVLVFTCHEHIFKLFKTLKVPVSRLPDNAESDHAPVTFEQPPKRKTKRSKGADPSPVRPAAEVEDDLPADEILAAQDEPVEDEPAGDNPTEAGIFEPADDADEDVLWDEDQLVEVKEIGAEEADVEDDLDEEDYEEEDYDEDEDEYEWEEADDADDEDQYEDGQSDDDQFEDDDTAEAA